MSIKRYKVSGMSCAACSTRVERCVREVRGVTSCSVNLLTGSLAVEGEASSDAVIYAVTKAGYGIEEENKNPKKDNKSLQNSEKSSTMRRLFISLLILFPLMYISMGHVMLAAPLPRFISESPAIVALIEMTLSAAVLVVNRRFFISGIRAALKGAPNMDTLVSLGSGASFAYSVGLIFAMCFSPSEMAEHYLHGLYFESAAMILALISVGKMLEERAKGKTTGAISSLLSLSPKLARVIRDGVEVEIPAEDVMVGDVFVLRPGDSIPSDGVVLRGESSVFEAALTGESTPVDKKAGDSVLAATVNGSGYLECRAQKVGADTVIAEVIRLVDEASSGKAPIARAADRVSAVFVPAVLVISLLSFVIWLVSGAEIGYALARSISVLVISCPCALGLATPVAIMVGVGVGAQRGILYKSAEAIEAVGRAKTVAFDKTGTLTEGKPTVYDVIPLGESEGELIRLALTLEEKSEHPLARAVVEYAERQGVAPYESGEFEAVFGSGVVARIDGIRCTAGSLSFVSGECEISADVKNRYEMLAKSGKTPVFVTRGGTLVGIFGIADKVRPNARELLEKLSRLGLKTVMLTGDNSYTGSAIGDYLGIDEVYSELLPADKEKKVRELRENGGVIMVGDGINDAPSLVSSDVGIAVCGGTDIAVESADVVLMREDLSEVYHSVRLGRAVLRNIYENLFWAFIYNAFGIPLAAGAFIGIFGWELSPMIAAFAMSLSSFSVVMNALRLNFYGKAKIVRAASCQYGIAQNEYSGNKAQECTFCDMAGVSQNKGAEKAAPQKEVKAQPETKEKFENGTDQKGEIDAEENRKKRTDKPCDKETESKNMTVIMKIEGMMCPHCEARVKKTLSSIEGVISAEVSHESGEAKVVGENLNRDILTAAVEADGYTVKSCEKE